MAEIAKQRDSVFARIAGNAHVVALATAVALVVAAPLLVGSVHPWAIWLATALAALSLLSCVVASAGLGRPLRGARYSPLLILLAAFPLLQIVPLPIPFRRLVDPVGVELLQNAPAPPFSSFPLSLDPQTTRIELLRAGIAIIVFLLCLNFSIGRRGYAHVLLKCIAASALLGVAIGVGHPLLRFDKLYGTFDPGGNPTLVGPFINPNHSAEFFELGLFTALACAFQATGRAARLSWMAGAAVCAAASLATLSRGSLIGMSAGLLAVAVFFPRATQTPPVPTLKPSSVGLLILSFVVLTIGLAYGLGAVPILGQLSDTHLGTGTEKTQIWLDSLRVLSAHPAGIGRGAFDRVYPAYRTISTPVQQTFIENGPLQLLVDLGWIGFLCVVAALVLFVLAVRRRRLKDRVEAALIGALVALMAHNLFDFGLETLGLRLPFVAVAGVLVGRLLGGKRPAKAGRTKTWIPVTVAVTSVLIGIQALAVSRSFDSELVAAKGIRLRELAIEAGRVHPTDYFFPLRQAAAEPIWDERRSPRLTALTRATRLCPNCSNVHRTTASTLWRLGLKQQALIEYRVAMDLVAPEQFVVFDELYANGASHAHVANLRPKTPSVAVGVCRALINRQATGTPPLEAIRHASSVGGDPAELSALRIELALLEGDLPRAESLALSFAKEHRSSPTPHYWVSVVEDRQGKKKEALLSALQGVQLHPDNVNLARQRASLAVQLGDWGELEGSIVGLTRALQSVGATAAEAYIISANANVRRGNLPRALRDYEVAANLEPANIDAWLGLATTAENGGFYEQALNAYQMVLKASKDHTESKKGVIRIEALRQRARLEGAISQ